MAVTITGLDKELGIVLDEVAATLNKERHQIANNMAMHIAMKASSGRTRFTKAATRAEVRSDLNKVAGKWGRSILRVKHTLAIKSLKGQGQPVTWEAVKREAKRIEKIKQASRSFLRAGWLWPAYSMGIAAKRHNKGGNRNARGFQRGGAGAFGKGAVKSKRFSNSTPATPARPIATIENLAVWMSARRTIPDYQAAVFRRGNIGNFKALGEAGLAKAARDQIAFEKRTLPRALASQVRRAAKEALTKQQGLAGCYDVFKK